MGFEEKKHFSSLRIAKVQRGTVHFHLIFQPCIPI
jgi:hypothetical protein